MESALLIVFETNLNHPPFLHCSVVTLSSTHQKTTQLCVGSVSCQYDERSTTVYHSHLSHPGSPLNHVSWSPGCQIGHLYGFVHVGKHHISPKPHWVKGSANRRKRSLILFLGHSQNGLQNPQEEPSAWGPSIIGAPGPWTVAANHRGAALNFVGHLCLITAG